MPPDADDELARAAAAGSSAAFGELIRAHKGRIFSMAAGYARNHHELDDLAQDIFIRAWRGLPTWQGTAPFGHWLARVAVRACYDFLRRHRQRRAREVSRDALLADGVILAEPEAGSVAVDENAALARVRRAMSRLHPRDQLVLTLLELEDRPVREVAALTGWSESNVKVRAHRARARLRQQLEADPDRA